jgi:hypothetical protein
MVVSMARSVSRLSGASAFYLTTIVFNVCVASGLAGCDSAAIEVASRSRALSGNLVLYLTLKRADFLCLVFLDFDMRPVDSVSCWLAESAFNLSGAVWLAEELVYLVNENNYHLYSSINLTTK